MSEASDNEAVRPGAPGLFAVLVARGVVTPEQLAPLLGRLPEEQYVRTSARGGEAFDSTRWPLARDAALARFIASRYDDPALARALLELADADGDPARLRALARLANARLIAAYGGEVSMFTQVWGAASPAELAAFTGPPADPASANCVADLCSVHHEAADGLYAYHLHRGLAGAGAEAAARLAERAIAAGRLDAEELVAAALGLLGAGPQRSSGS